MFSFSVKVFPLRNPSGTLVAMASLIIEDIISIDDFKIIDGAKGLFVGAPSREIKNKEGKRDFKDRVWFQGDDGKAAREEISAAMIEEYQRQVAGTSRQAAAKAQAEAQKPEDQKPEKRSYARPAW